MDALFDKLTKYCAGDTLPMHMPGHKRNTAMFPELAGLGCGIDITEIDGFDNLNDPQSLFLDLEKRAARLWGSDDAICLVNGSTCGVLAAVHACLCEGGALLMQRGSHRSMYHAAELVGAETYYLTPRTEPTFGIQGSVAPEDVASALDAHPDIRLVALTSPTYEGVISDIRSIAELCHRRSVPLLVDGAHGAHLGFGGFPPSSVALGADITVQSLHKTLPSLTQTAVMHCSGGLVRPERLRRSAAIFQSSSPSYILSASIDFCIDYLSNSGDEAARRWSEALDGFYRASEGLANLKIFTGGENIFSRDPSKLLIFSGSPQSLAQKLRDDYRIETEMTGDGYVLAMTGMGDTSASLERLSNALSELDGRFSPFSRARSDCDFLPEKVMSLSEAAGRNSKPVKASESAGYISAEYVFSYPPGTPILAPGEKITERLAATLSDGRGLRSTYGKLPAYIFCVVL